MHQTKLKLMHPLPKIQQKDPKERVKQPGSKPKMPKAQRVNSLDLNPRCQTKRFASGAKGTHILVINVLPKTQRADFARNKATLSGHVSKKKGS